METIKGPAIFLAQFAGDKPPFNSLPGIASWAAKHGYQGVQIPSWNARLFDLARAAESGAYCDEVLGILADCALSLTELSTHLQGQLVAVHPAYDLAFDGFAPAMVRGNPRARQEWAVQHMLLAAKASRNLSLAAHATFSGALAWPAAHASRIPGGHPEGYLETFAQLYRDIAEQIIARKSARAPDPASRLVPGIAEALRGMRFIAAAVASSAADAAWMKL